MKNVFSSGVKNINFDQFLDGFHSKDQCRSKEQMFLHKKNMILHGCRGYGVYEKRYLSA